MNQPDKTHGCDDDREAAKRRHPSSPVKPLALDNGTNAEVEVRGNSVHINPPSGRSYWACFSESVCICIECQGEGHWDSCFDCGNRGYFVLS